MVEIENSIKSSPRSLKRKLEKHATTSSLSTSPHKVGGLLKKRRSLTSSKESGIRPKPKPHEEIQNLVNTFPSFPTKMLFCLLIQNNGNCNTVHKILTTKGWIATNKRKNFTDRDDPHLIIPYYFGRKPSEEQLKTIFEKSKPRTFITYYNDEPTNNGFRYFMGYKQDDGSLTESPISSPVVSPLLADVLEMDEYLPCLSSRDITWIPLVNQ